MNEFLGWTHEQLVHAIHDLRRKLEAEKALVKQVEGANAAEVSDLKNEVDAQRWSATRHQHRAEAFKEVIAMIGGGK